MEKIERLKNEIKRLAQRRYFLEKSCQNTGEMLPVSLIFRKTIAGDRYKWMLKNKRKGYGPFAYLTWYDGKKMCSKYVRKESLSKIQPLVERYRQYCQKIKEVCLLNKRITKLIDEIAELNFKKVEEVYAGTRENRGRGTRRSESGRRGRK